MEQTALAVLIGVILGFGIGYGVAKKRKGKVVVVLPALLLLGGAVLAENPCAASKPATGPAYWAEATAPIPPGTWTLPVSLAWFPGYTSSFSWPESGADPQLDAQVHSTLGFGAGLGYRFPGGVEVAGQVMYTRTDFDARWVVPDFSGASLQRSGDRDRVGLVLTLSTPLRAGK